MKIKSAPVLLITFNRPDITWETFNAIRTAKPERFYFFNDAPRAGNKKDLEAREEIKKMIRHIDWPCELFQNFSESNLGCGLGVSSAISWAFSNEDRLIILEDDCVAALPFFDYCNELLEKYKDDNRIWHISGNNYNEEAAIPYSYFFSNYVHIWGWATWKRCWKHFDFNLNTVPKFIEFGGFNNVFFSKRERLFFNQKLLNTYFNTRATNAWALQFWYMVSAQGGLSIIPRYNLVKNIGIEGVHSSKTSFAHNRAINNDFRILTHPPFIIPNRFYELNHFKKHWQCMIGIFQRIKLLIRCFFPDNFQKSNLKQSSNLRK